LKGSVLVPLLLVASSARTTTPRRADGRAFGAVRTEHRGFAEHSWVLAERFNRTDAEAEVTAAIASCGLREWLEFSGLLDPDGGGGRLVPGNAGLSGAL